MPPIPDIVGNLRVDQAWGSAQIMGGLHNSVPRYGTALGSMGLQYGVTPSYCGHPGDRWGSAVNGGLTLNLPWVPRTPSSSDRIPEGARWYVAFRLGNRGITPGGRVSVGAGNDAVYGGMGGTASSASGNPTGAHHAWGDTVGIEHYWTPGLRTSWVADTWW